MMLSGLSELLRDGARIKQRDFRIERISGDVWVGIQPSLDVRIGRITYGYDLIKSIPTVSTSGYCHKS